MSRKRGFSGYDQRDMEQELPHHLRYRNTGDGGAVGDGATFAPGQRWISTAEPDLGVGVVATVDGRRVTLSFLEESCTRQYTKEGAPLKRVLFKVGDRFQVRGGLWHTVEAAEVHEGLMYYSTAEGTIDERSLSDTMVFTAPLDRLVTGHHDSSAQFDLRRRALEFRCRTARSAVRGFVGGRIELIPHQLYIAREVSERQVRRVLLADEVGLGKTIEACLILHRLMVGGRMARALIVVPESMVHVWFVELLRKFNLLFRIVDEQLLEEVGRGASSADPFLDASLVLTDSAALLRHGKARERAVAAGWDMLIVDEAHHLEEGGPLYAMIAELAAASRDVLLLTATPEHHGSRSHFARLRLLDPARYADYEVFVRESNIYRQVANLAGRLLDADALSDEELDSLREFSGVSGEMVEACRRADADNVGSARRASVAALLDRHGVGRAMFRNSRAVVGGFPKRHVVLRSLPVPAAEKGRMESVGGGDGRLLGGVDPRVEYVAELLRANPDEKVLLICRSKDLTIAVDEALRRLVGYSTALFHEDLSLIQRDRNAAWFAEEEGARILLCSEIGSEGRNFQFVHHLVLFDLPADPELVEQRIGRLDRIGQRGPVVIHVPYLENSSGEVLARWYHEGMGLFEAPCPAAGEVFEAMGEPLLRMAAQPKPKGEHEELERLIAQTRELTAVVDSRLRSGRDRLLEQHSFRADEARELVEGIRTCDGDDEIGELFSELLQARGILVEETAQRTWRLWSPAEVEELFPGLRSSRPMVTFDRTTALRREDYEFLSADHPAVGGAVELFLGSETGNAALALLPAEGEKELLLEAIYVMECMAPPGVEAMRFLPPVPIRVIIDHKGRDRTEEFPEGWEDALKPLDAIAALENPDVRQRLIPAMQRKAAGRADGVAQATKQEALREVRGLLGNEVDRLVALSAGNPAVTLEEIDAARSELGALETAIGGAVPRLDAVRLVLKAPGN